MRNTLNYRPGVQSYLRGIPLTHQGRIRQCAGINDAAEVSDQFRADPANRAGPGSPLLSVAIRLRRRRPTALAHSHRGRLSGALRRPHCGLGRLCLTFTASGRVRPSALTRRHFPSPFICPDARSGWYTRRRPASLEHRGRHVQASVRRYPPAGLCDYARRHACFLPPLNRIIGGRREVWRIGATPGKPLPAND